MKISSSKVRELIKFNPHLKQLEVINNKDRFVTLCWGRRTGKTMLASYFALIELLKPNKNIWIVAPSYDLTTRCWDYLIPWIDTYFKDLFKVNNSAREINSKHNSRLELKSAENPHSLIGIGLDLLIIDEAARIPEKIYTQNLRPTLSDKNGRVLFISTPFGLNWFYQTYNKGVAGNTGYYSSHASTSDNPLIASAEIEEAKLNIPENIFKQEYLAQFVEGAGTVFRNIDKIIFNDCLKDPEQGHTYLMGVDLAKHSDYTVLTIIDRYDWHVVFWERFKDLDWRMQKLKIAHLSLKYNNALCRIDSSGVGDPIVEELISDGVPIDPYKFTSVSKRELIENLMIKIEQQEIAIPKISVLLDELKSFSYYISEQGNLRYSAPSGQHDDCVISLALAVFNLRHKPLTADERSILLPVDEWAKEKI